MRVSYTQLDTYKLCPRKFKFYIDRAPQDPSRTTALRFGSAVHKALEFAFSNKHDPPATARVLDYYRKIMAEETDPLVLTIFQKGLPALEQYLAKNNPREQRTVAIEKKFSMQLTAAHEMVGVIDRLDQLPDGSFEVMDYKTGAPMNAEKLGENWQLAIYQLVKMRELQTERIRTSLVYVLYDGHKLSYQFATEELDRIRDAILRQIDVMERDAVFPTKTGWWCKTCPYQPICPAWTHKAEAKGVVTGKERDQELVDIQARVDRLLQVIAAQRRLKEEADAIKEALGVYSRERKLTRLFSDLGTVSFSFRRRAVYDVARLVEVLQADILRKIVRTVDTGKLEKALPYLSEEDRERIEAFRKEEENTTVTARPRIAEDTEELLTP